MGIVYKHSRPNHPQTFGKVERWHQTLKRFLVKQPPAHAVDQLEGQRRELLRLYYDDRIGAYLFAEEEARLALAIAAAHGESEAARLELAKADDVSRRFEDVSRVLEDLDIDRAWAARANRSNATLLSLRATTSRLGTSVTEGASPLVANPVSRNLCRFPSLL
jgi:hypothetical protein